jgi:predicted Ser/Thr protein kinase
VQPTQKSPAGSGAGFEPPSPEELSALFPQLEILELLGKGGMGAVYKARQSGLDRLVALKVLPPELGGDGSFAERFTREARALARLSHPNIVGVYDFGQTAFVEETFGRPSGSVGDRPQQGRDRPQQGLFYIVMEYVDGANLRQTIEAGGLGPQQALAIVPQICEALQFAHDEGIVHRDIKPENVLIDKRGRVKIADFGLAKLVGQEARDHFLTGTHQVMGTLRYMAPEQMQGSREVDHRADIYSLGVVFYEMLTGELPMGKFAPPSKKVQVDVRLDEIVLRALEQEPEQRYQHASEVKTDVETINRTPPLTREAQGSAQVESASGEELKPIKLLEAANYRKRLLQGLPVYASGLCFLVAISLILVIPTQGPAIGAFIYTGAALAVLGIVICSIVKVGWTVEYRGHRIGCEHSVFTGTRLSVDGWPAASRLPVGPFKELRATIREGQGVGDEIIATSEAGFFCFSCRIIALPKTPVAHAAGPLPAAALQRRQSEADVESISRSQAPVRADQADKPGLAPGFWFLLGVGLFAAGMAMTRGTPGLSPGMVLTFAGIACWIWELIRSRASKWGRRQRATTPKAELETDSRLHPVTPTRLEAFSRRVPIAAWIALVPFVLIYVAASAELQQQADATIARAVAVASLCFAAVYLSVYGVIALVRRSRRLADQPSIAKPRPWRIVTFFSLLFFLTSLFVINWVFNPVSRSAAMKHPERGPVVSTRPESDIPAPEPPSGWVMKSDARVLTDAFGRTILKLEPAQIEQVNEILQSAYRDYLAIEQQYTEQHIDDLGHVVTIIRPVPLARLENQLWTGLDEVFDAKQQSTARLNLKLDPAEVRTGVTIDELVRPGFFGWGKYGVRIEIWRVGAWYHCKVSTREYGNYSFGPQLPDEYRRFWKEPAEVTPQSTRQQ